jgi:hypothetical protein
MFIGMQDTKRSTKIGYSRDKLFPDLAPYGEVKPLPVTKSMNEHSQDKPHVFIVQPNITEQPLSVQNDPKLTLSPIAEASIAATDMVHAPRTRWHPTLSNKIIILLLIGVFLGGWSYIDRTINPVPKSISSLVNFPIYYPDQKKLPAGYILIRDSFRSPIENGIGYTVNYGENQHIVFSVQKTPSDSEAQAFNDSYIPARTDYLTPLGQAEIGTYKSQLLVSLPIKNGSWLVITAPLDINIDQLKTVLQTLKK